MPSLVYRLDPDLDAASADRTIRIAVHWCMFDRLLASRNSRSLPRARPAFMWLKF